MVKPNTISWIVLILLASIGPALISVDDASAEVPFATPHDVSGGSVSGVTSLVAGDIDGERRAADVDGDGDPNILGQDAYAQDARPWVYENLQRR